jgi:elongator complex protein 5
MILKSMDVAKVPASKETIAIAAEGEDDPTANLTFNLNLSDSEKKAREQVVLPFMQKGRDAKKSGQGKIFYEAEDEDDFDEEDPDDDLNI